VGIFDNLVRIEGFRVIKNLMPETDLLLYFLE